MRRYFKAIIRHIGLGFSFLWRHAVGVGLFVIAGCAQLIVIGRILGWPSTLIHFLFFECVLILAAACAIAIARYEP